MKTVDIHEAAIQLSQLIDEAVAGEDIVISRAGKRLIRLARVSKRPIRRFGLLEGKLHVPDDFDAPLPADVLNSFEA